MVRVQGQQQGGNGEGTAEGDAPSGAGTVPGRSPHGSRAHAGKTGTGAPAPGTKMGESRKGDQTDDADMPPGSHAQHRDQPPPGIPDRVQDMIRQALRQPPLGGRQAGEDERRQAKNDPPQAEKLGGDQQQARADGRDNRDQNPQQSNPAGTPPQHTDGAQSGRGSNSSGGGQGTSGIYSNQAASAPKENANKSFALKLVLLGQSSRATMETQKSKRGGVGDLGIPREQAPTDAPLNPNQRADEPLARSEIPAEHETMIKRIFSRSE